MMIVDPDPIAKVSAVRDSLNDIVDSLRQLGAEAAVTEDFYEGLYTIALTIAVPCSTDKALSLSSLLQNFARNSGSTMQDMPLGADSSGIHDVEYRAALIYTITKPCRPQTRRRAA